MESAKTPSLPEASGVVYMYTCKANGKSYIGQTWDIAERQRSHRRAGGGSRLFHRAVRLHSYEAFEFCLLHEGVADQAHLDILEWLEIRQRETMAPKGYNLMDEGIGGSHSEESRCAISKATARRFADPAQRAAMAQRISQFHADPIRGAEHKEKIRKAWENNPEYRRRVMEAAKRRKNDPVWKEKNSLAQKRRSEKLQLKNAGLPPKHAKLGSPEYYEKMKAAAVKISKPVVCIESGRVFVGAREASRELGLKIYGNICKAIKSGSKSGGYHWRYATAEEAKSVGC